MSVGIDAIDSDHKKLLSLLNEMDYIINVDVSRKGAVKSVLCELIDYTEYHFQREEDLLRACGYPQIDMHHQVHEVLKAQVHHFVDQHRQDPDTLDLETLRYFLELWLLDHIKGMDKDYEDWVKGKEI